MGHLSYCLQLENAIATTRIKLQPSQVLCGAAARYFRSYPTKHWLLAPNSNAVSSNVSAPLYFLSKVKCTSVTCWWRQFKLTFSLSWNVLELIQLTTLSCWSECVCVGNDSRNICSTVTLYTATDVKQEDIWFPLDPFTSVIWKRQAVVPTSGAV